MKQKTFTLLLVFGLFFIGSCSKKEPAILGKWMGEVVQPNFGTIELFVELNKLQIDQSAGRLTSEVVDISACDENQFECKKGTCQADWIFKGNKGENFLFLEKQREGSACGDGNTIAKLTEDNRLEFTWTDVSDPSNQSSGLLIRQ